MNNASWKSSSQHQKKPWGFEITWMALPNIHGKILHINKGCRTSFKYNELKNEVLYVLSGKLLITYGAEKSKTNLELYPLEKNEFNVGDVLNVQPGSPYRLEALDDCEVIEIGNMQSAKTIRVLDDYDRPVAGEPWAKGL